MFVDTHCHLTAASLTGRLPELLRRAADAGVTRFIVPGVGAAEWDELFALCDRWRTIYPAPGIHPFRADSCDDEALYRLEQHSVSAVAIGEIGLDYSCALSRSLQQHAFRSQLHVALRHGLPVIVHCRKAFADALSILREAQVWRVGGVMHAFSGSPEIAAECVGLGLTIGVAGPVTFENAIRPVEVVRRTPLASLLLETDAPDLTPSPHRGSCNEPAFLIHIARKVAAIKGISIKEVAEVTTNTAVSLFRLS